MKVVEVIVENACNNLSAYIEGVPIFTVGNDLKEIEKHMTEAIDLYLEESPNPCEILKGEFTLRFKTETA